jgi:hypothetical protein
LIARGFKECKVLDLWIFCFVLLYPPKGGREGAENFIEMFHEECWEIVTEMLQKKSVFMQFLFVHALLHGNG